MKKYNINMSSSQQQKESNIAIHNSNKTYNIKHNKKVRNRNRLMYIVHIILHCEQCSYKKCYSVLLFINNKNHKLSNLMTHWPLCP